MTKDEKKQRIAELFTRCYETVKTNNGNDISYIELNKLFNEPLFEAQLPEQFSPQKLWYWKQGKSIPLPTPFILLKQFTREDDWRYELANEVLEVINNTN